MGCLPLGSTISHYSINELIATGGMGEVYKATDTQLGRLVALKTLLPVLAAEPKSRLRFMQEARTASGLYHPSICTVFEVGQDGDFAFIAMQYVEGKTIQKILAEGSLPIDTALGYAVQVAEALEEAHAHGIIHRDIKPSNIIVDERGRAVVLDFGLAKLIQPYGSDDDDSPTVELLTTSPQVIGTTAYMSPEQIRSEEVDQRSDVFSFGVLLYETLSGTRPFKGKSKIDILHAILYDQPPPICELRPEIAKELETVIERALEKNRDSRYQSITDLKLDLIKLIQERGRLASGASTQPIDPIDNDLATAMQSNRYIRWRSSTIAFAAIALLAIIAAIASWRLLRSGNQTAELQSSLRIALLANWKNEPGSNVSDQSFSRDGAMIAFTSNKDGGYSNVYVKQTNGNGQPIRITNNKANDTSPIWSPDNQRLAFASSSEGDNRRTIWTVPSLGGTPTQLKTLESGKLSLRYWSKDGSTIYYDWRTNLYSMSLDTKETKQITNLDASMNAVDFSISPNEDRICYVARKNGQLDIWVMPLHENATPFQITNDDAEDRYPVWHPDGKRIIYSSNRAGTFQICVAYLSGNKPWQVTFGENDSLVTGISPDGGKILYSSTKDDADLWRVDLDSNIESQLTADVGVELWPDLSPDGDLMAFQATSGPNIGGLRVFNCLIMAKPPKIDGRVIQLATDGFDPRWSPDGSKLAFLRRTGNAINIWTVQPNGAGEKQITRRGIVQGGFSVLPSVRTETRDYCWSSDGTKIAYCSLTGGQFDAWMISADGANETKLSNESAQNRYFSPLWSHDGHHLAYIGRSNGQATNDKRTWSIWMAQLGESVSIYETDSALRLLGWSKTDNELIVAFVEHRRDYAITADDVTVAQISALGRTVQPLARLKSAYLANLQLSPDGQRLAFASRENGVDNIWVQPIGGGDARRVTSNTDARTFISSLSWAPDGKAIYYGKQSSFNLISILDNFR